VLTWAITRAASESSVLVDELVRAGLQALSVPCIERTLRPVAPWRPPGHRVILFTSVAAVEAVAAHLPACTPADIAALAPVTSAALALISPALKPTIESGEGVVSLAHAVLRALDSWSIRTASFWYPTSAAGFDAPEQHEAMAVLSSVGQVTRVAVYDVGAPSGLVDQLKQLPREVGVVFTSPSAVKHFISAHSQLGLTPSVKVAACWGASTRREAEAHFSHTHTLPRSQPLAVALRELEKTNG
jgi:uroporphyrinogen-III synthase